MDDEARVSRRRALKAALGTGVAVAAWNAPHIDGLAIRPNYAAAGTGGGGSSGDIFTGPANCNANMPASVVIGSYTITFSGTQKLDDFDWELTRTDAGDLPSGCGVATITCTEEGASSYGATPFSSGNTSGTGIACASCPSGTPVTNIQFTLLPACV